MNEKITIYFKIYNILKNIQIYKVQFNKKSINPWIYKIHKFIKFKLTI